MKLFGVLIVLGFCVFMGITAVSMGFGAIFPDINQIAQPFVCPNGTMTAETRRANPYPGKTVTTARWSCVEGKSVTPLSLMSVAGCAGSIYGVVLAIPLLILMARRKKTTFPAPR